MKINNGLRCLLLFPGNTETVALASLDQALEESGYVVDIWRTDEIPNASEPPKEPLQTLIQRADFIVADLTGHSPNVIYGLGLADAFRKPVLLIVQENHQPIPSTFNGEIFLIYNPTQLDRLLDYVKAWARHYQKAAAA